MKRFRILEISFMLKSQLESEMNEEIASNETILSLVITREPDSVQSGSARIILEILPD